MKNKTYIGLLVTALFAALGLWIAAAVAATIALIATTKEKEQK